MSDTKKTFAEYLIVQHMPDIFRRETRNIGVFVRMGNQINAKFFGENAAGEIDANQLSVLPFPDVYRQWIAYWRRTLIKSPETAWEEVLDTGKVHYQVIKGGIVDSIDDDPIADVTDFLYGKLVSGGPWSNP